LALRSCREPALSSTSTVPDVVMPYPGSDDEILSTWKQRNDEFQTYTLPTRSGWCLFSQNPRVHISEHSLEGSSVLFESLSLTNLQLDPTFEREDWPRREDEDAVQV
jgi:hypothetical protein